MVTGVECAGLILAVLPFFIEAAKVYSHGVDSILDVAIKDRRDENLADFYDDFYFEIVCIEEQVKKICGSVAAGCSSTRALPRSTELFEQWNVNPDLEACLRSYFGSDDRFNEFTRISSRVLLLLQKLIKDKSNRLTSREQVRDVHITR